MHMTSDQNEQIVKRLDMTGKQCYQIRLELRVQIREVEIGDIIQVTTDNPQSSKSMQKWCLTNNQELFLSEINNDKYVYFIKRIV